MCQRWLVANTDSHKTANSITAPAKRLLAWVTNLTDHEIGSNNIKVCWCHEKRTLDVEQYGKRGSCGTGKQYRTRSACISVVWEGHVCFLIYMYFKISSDSVSWQKVPWSDCHRCSGWFWPLMFIYSWRSVFWHCTSCIFSHLLSKA